jgi:hypothetical protein
VGVGRPVVGPVGAEISSMAGKRERAQRKITLFIFYGQLIYLWLSTVIDRYLD